MCGYARMSFVWDSSGAERVRSTFLSTFTIAFNVNALDSFSTHYSRFHWTSHKWSRKKLCTLYQWWRYYLWWSQSSLFENTKKKIHTAKTNHNTQWYLIEKRNGGKRRQACVGQFITNLHDRARRWIGRFVSCVASIPLTETEVT